MSDMLVLLEGDHGERLDEREPVISISCGPTWLLCLRMPVVRLAAQEIEGGCKS